MNDFKTYTVSPDEKQEIISVIKSFLEGDDRIVFAYIFGSFVDPEIPFFRDIDIGVYIRDYRKSDWQRYALKLPNELEKQLNYRYPVDLSIINEADILLVKNIIQGNLLFVKDEDLWADFVVDASMRYNDIAPLFDYYFKEAHLEK
jgi:predicted nucleotidyltransferase